MDGYVILEDGEIFKGQIINSYIPKNKCYGEVVFNTGMTGYQEILTDPSYKGQIITMTYPLIGNYGIDDAYKESDDISVSGFIVSEITDNLARYLIENNVPTIAGVDTRRLVKHVREKGVVNGYIIDEDIYKLLQLKNISITEALKNEIKPDFNKTNLVEMVSTKSIYTIGEGTKNIALIDFGCKKNIIESLRLRGCSVTVLPYNTSADKIKKLNPDGIFLSNGPGNPKDVECAIENVKDLIGFKPIFGICLGHQIIALSLGCDTFKLKYGHRGCNHPVKDLKTGRVYITSQNHGYSVRHENIPEYINVTHLNLNDETIEGIEDTRNPIFSIQYHPEACPGPEDSNYIFDKFLEVINCG